MKHLSIFLILFFGYFYNSTAQSCFTNRYQDEIFNSQVTQDVQFAIADPYGISTSQTLRMDIYEPIADSCTQRPLIVYAFGGAYLIGDKRQPDVPLVCNHFAKQGFVVVSIDYRIGFNTISTGSAMRAVYRGIQDLRSAVRFMCENRDVYKIDTNFVFYSGSSAGCISGIHAAYLTDADRPSYTFAGAVLLEPDDMGCVDCSGNTLFNQHVPKPAGIINRWGAILDTNYISNMALDSVPMISFHGTADPAVPYTIGNPFSFPVFPIVMGSSYIHDRLNKMHIFNQLVPLVGAGHEPELLEPRWDDTLFNRCTPFLYQILKPKTSAILGETNLCNFDSSFYSVTLHPNSKYCWSIDSGVNILFQNENQIKVQFTSTGNHVITLIEQNSLYCTGDTIKLTVHVVNSPMPNFTCNTNELNASFNNLSTDATAYSWFFGDGTSIAAFSPNHIYADTGEYKVTLIAANATCIDTIIKYVTIRKCPIANFTAYVDVTGELYLFNNSTYTTSCEWLFGDGDSSNLFNPSHTYSTNGNYFITLFAYNDSNCVDTLTNQISVLLGITNSSSANLGIAVYPNPTTDIIRVESKEMIQKCILLNTKDQVVFESNIPLSHIKIKMEQLDAGIYYLKLISKNSSNIVKILKQ